MARTPQFIERQDQNFVCDRENTRVWPKFFIWLLKIIYKKAQKAKFMKGFLQFHKNNKRVLWTWESCGLKPYVFLIQNAWRPSRVNHTFLLSKLREHCLQIKKIPEKMLELTLGPPPPHAANIFFLKLLLTVTNWKQHQLSPVSQSRECG